MVYNIIHNIGYLYDAVYFLVLHHNKMKELEDKLPAEKNNWFYKLGIYYGTLVYRLFYTETQVEEVDPLAQIMGVIPGWAESIASVPREPWSAEYL